MTLADADGRLELLAQLGGESAQARGPDHLARLAVDGLARLGWLACLSTVHGDMARADAVALPELPPGQRRAAAILAGVMLELTLPVDGLPATRDPVRRGVPYVGPQSTQAFLDAVPAFDQGLAARLRGARPSPVVAVPIEVGDRIRAVLWVWGPTAGASEIPLLEGVGAHLAAAWETEVAPAGGAPARHRGPARIGRSAAEEVREVLDSGGLRSALQPVIRLHDGAVAGYEALCRFPRTQSIASPDELFTAASACGLVTEVDSACVRAAMAEATHAGAAPLFVNVTMAALLGRVDPVDCLVAAAEEAGVEPSGVVLEYSERDPVVDVASLRRVTAALRAHGFRIAVDDAGAGHASLRVIAEIRPDFIKVDRSLITSVDDDRARRALVVALLSFSAHIGARLIAEGIETEGERQALLDLGVLYGQGWLLCRPVMVSPGPGLSGVTPVDHAWFSQQATQPFAAETPATPLTVRLAPGPARSPLGRRGSLPRALSDAALALQNEHDRSRILQVIAEQLRQVVPVDEMVIYAADYEDHRFVPLLATGPDAEQILAHSFSLDVGLTGWAFALGRPAKIRDSAAHPATGWVPGTSVVPESLLLIPLIAGDRRMGMLNCYRPGVDRFSSRDLEAGTLFGHMAAAAWRNAQLYSELVEAATTDPLTGLLNTRWLRDAGPREVAQSARNREQMAVLLIDLDHFKLVNDSCGHAGGDVVLRRVARQLRSLVRRGDAVVRFGGEEFLLLLRATNLPGARRVAAAIRPALAAIHLPDLCSVERLTASVGIAVFPEHGGDLDTLIRAADLAMYAAKHAGRDRVETSWPVAIEKLG